MQETGLTKNSPYRLPVWQEVHGQKSLALETVVQSTEQTSGRTAVTKQRIHDCMRAFQEEQDFRYENIRVLKKFTKEVVAKVEAHILKKNIPIVNWIKLVFEQRFGVIKELKEYQSQLAIMQKQTAQEIFRRNTETIEANKSYDPIQFAVLTPAQEMLQLQSVYAFSVNPVGKQCNLHVYKDDTITDYTVNAHSQFGTYIVTDAEGKKVFNSVDEILTAYAPNSRSIFALENMRSFMEEKRVLQKMAYDDALKHLGPNIARKETVHVIHGMNIKEFPGALALHAYKYADTGIFSSGITTYSVVLNEEGLFELRQGMNNPLELEKNVYALPIEAFKEYLNKNHGVAITDEVELVPGVVGAQVS